MKTKNSFTTNSSSSSYLIAVKNGILDDEKKKALEGMGFDETYKEIAEELMSKEEIIDKIFLDTDRDMVGIKGWKIVFGECANDSDIIGMMLYNLGTVKTDSFIFTKSF